MLNRIYNAFDAAFKQKEQKNWDTIYILVDLHGTIFYPTYEEHEQFLFYPNAKEVLQILSKEPLFNLILWTSTYDDDLRHYIDVLEKNDIHFDQVNENALEPSNRYACFDRKFYFNIGIDDKFGFYPKEDWTYINMWLNNNLERLNNNVSNTRQN